MPYLPDKAGDQRIENAAGHSYRQGFFIGDGTGVGKGREAAACIMDQWCRGRHRHAWIRLNGPLLQDVRRDWSALGGLDIDIQPLDAIPLDEPIGMSAGILFLTYSALRSVRDQGVSRLDQILAWLGEEFDGVIVLDESHSLANAAPAASEFGDAVASQQGIAGLRLQNALPRARILYVSATGATRPANLGYAARLGLWGEGSAFAQCSEAGIPRWFRQTCSQLRMLCDPPPAPPPPPVPPAPGHGGANTDFDELMG